MRLLKVLLLRSRIFPMNSNLMSYEKCSLIKVAALMIAELTNCLKLKSTESQAQVFQDMLRTQGDLSGGLNLG